MTRFAGVLNQFRNGKKTGETEPTRRKVVRRIKFGIVIVACVVTLQSVLLVLGAWRNDQKIESNMGVAQAEVLSA